MRLSKADKSTVVRLTISYEQGGEKILRVYEYNIKHTEILTCGQ